MDLVSSVVGSLAWPAVVLTAVVILQGPIRQALQNRSLEALELGPGGFKLSFVDRVLEEASAAIGQPRVEARRAADAVSDPVQQDHATLLDLVDVSPNAAVLDAFSRVERALAGVVERDQQRRPVPAYKLAQMAVEQRWLAPDVARSVEDLSRVRNAVAHGEGFVTPDQAKWFVDLSCALLILLRGDPPKR